jgi:hypothetical protein
MDTDMLRLLRSFVLPLVIIASFAVVPFVGAVDAFPAAILVYADDLFEVEILDFTGAPVEPVDFGSELLIGFAIRTGATTAELRLEHNGSAILVAANTFLKIEELQGVSGSEVNSAALIDGQIRMVAARVQGQNYRIRTSSVVLGVRGTDFSVAVESSGEATVAVEEGRVSVFEPQTRETIDVIAGEALAVRDRVLERIDGGIEAVSERLSSQLSEFRAVRLTDIPRNAIERSREAFDYFSDIDAAEHRAFFADTDFFDDFDAYRERFSDYYEDRFSEIRDRVEERAENLRDRAGDARNLLDERRDAIRDRLRSDDEHDDTP